LFPQPYGYTLEDNVVKIGNSKSYYNFISSIISAQLLNSSTTKCL